MTETPTDDQPGFVAEEVEHCHACHRLVQPGETYYVTVGQAILSEACLKSADAILVSGDLAVVVDGERLLVRRGGTAVEVHPREVRRLVDALANGGHQVVLRAMVRSSRVELFVRGLVPARTVLPMSPMHAHWRACLP